MAKRRSRAVSKHEGRIKRVPDAMQRGALLHRIGIVPNGEYGMVRISNALLTRCAASGTQNPNFRDVLKARSSR
jgi:hypothetical protein